MNQELIGHIETLLPAKIINTKTLSGGDISIAYVLETSKTHFFCKINSSTNALKMFQEEKKGLEAIAKTQTIATPDVFLCNTYKTYAFLIMEYVEPSIARKKDMECLGHQIALLHKSSVEDSFGWSSDNFIGNLSQSNKKHLNWSDFYVNERLLPQLKMARDLQLLTSDEIPTETQLFKICERFLPEIDPSLLHGDLWSGNYLISSTGTPYGIDPAVYYGHHEVDIAMTKLFGGFEGVFYDAYYEHFPKEEDETIRMYLYQLYYLLVHLNIFGNSYRLSVINILKKCF